MSRQIFEAIRQNGSRLGFFEGTEEFIRRWIDELIDDPELNAFDEIALQLNPVHVTEITPERFNKYRKLKEKIEELRSRERAEEIESL